MTSTGPRTLARRGRLGPQALFHGIRTIAKSSSTTRIILRKKAMASLREALPLARHTLLDSTWSKFGNVACTHLLRLPPPNLLQQSVQNSVETHRPFLLQQNAYHYILQRRRLWALSSKSILRTRKPQALQSWLPVPLLLSFLSLKQQFQ